jgi:hypothetical protein
VNSRLVGTGNVSGGARDFIDEIDFLDHGQAVSGLSGFDYSKVKTIYE